MSQIDNRNSSAVKRARTDGGRREDDWTCPSCANVNFSFRTTCNMRNCTQPRPADHNSKSAPRQTPTHQGYSSSSPYAGSGAPSSMYVGAPPYTPNLFNGTSVPPYDAPLSSGSAYHYNYNSRLPGGNLYRPLQFANTLPYSGGPMIGTGGLYGLPQLMEQFGLRLPLGQAAMGPRPGFFPEETSQKKDGTRENDWECPKCGNVNFSFRTVCNMRKCNTPKPGSQQTTKPAKSSNMPEGSWKCDQCNNINYPFRTKCNRQNCGAEKPLESEISPKEEEENEQ
uniref:ranBP2-type zinc finger protein At1g67325-like n=1 Tax=Erigeron canadensis TaxID=72917 RepID=UPI001CB968E0|nr:ranBP2-type zinc finger protein At1g67325-like [Erigeron canadensis]